MVGQGVVLTKDNLVKRHWKGCTNCCFCAEQETIQHLFFYCPIAQLTWGSVCLTFGVKNRREWNIFLVLGLEVFRVSKGTLCWSVWQPFVGPCGSARMIWFFKSHITSILQVIFRGTFWIRTWSILSKHEGRTILKDGCRALEGASLEIFDKLGWNALKCIGN
jgi:hypothetical protein